MGCACCVHLNRSSRESNNFKGKILFFAPLWIFRCQFIQATLLELINRFFSCQISSLFSDIYHSLYSYFYFPSEVVEICKDTSTYCKYGKQIGECTSKRSFTLKFMKKNCKKSCGLCKGEADTST